MVSLDPSGPDDAGDRRVLGLVQMAILGVVVERPDCAFGAGIAEAVSKETGRTMSDAQVHVALSRMEGRGFVRVVEGGVSTTSRTRGRPRKFYEITDGGRAALHASIGYLEATAIVSAEDETECVISGP